MSITEYTKSEIEIAGCLRRIFRNRFLLKTKNNEWFQKTIEHKQALQHSLNAFFLQLIVDESLGVIYLNPQSEEIEDAISYKISRKKDMTALSSLLLLQLRHERLQFYLNPDENTIPLVRMENLKDYARAFDKSDVDARFEKAFNKAIKELKELQILIETKENSEIFEITAICDLILPLDEIKDYRAKIKNYFTESSPDQNTPRSYQ